MLKLANMSIRHKHEWSHTLLFTLPKLNARLFNTVAVKKIFMRYFLLMVVNFLNFTDARLGFKNLGKKCILREKEQISLIFYIHLCLHLEI